MIPREKKGLIITPFGKTELRLALDRNSHWLKFQWNTELHIINSLVLKILIFSKMSDILGNNMSIAQVSYLLMQDSVSEKHYVNTENCTQLNQDTQKDTKHRKKNQEQSSSQRKKFYLYTKTLNRNHYILQKWFISLLVVGDVVISHITQLLKPLDIKQSHECRWGRCKIITSSDTKVNLKRP